MDIDVRRWMLVLLSATFSSVLFAAAIDDQTPTPNASLITSYTLSRQQCLNAQDGAKDMVAGEQCVSVAISYPSAMSANGVEDYILSVLVYRLSGQINSARSLTQAVDDFLNTQIARLKQYQSGGGSHVFSWQLLGQRHGLIVLSEDVLQHEFNMDDRVLRQFTVFDSRTRQSLELADILIAGYGEALAALQEQALLLWFMQHAHLSREDAKIAINALPLKYSENWALSQGALVFGYDPIIVNEQVQIPLVVLRVDALEGIIRPDILTEARSWPVNVALQIQQNNM